jgi:hypothetical protein
MLEPTLGKLMLLLLVVGVCEEFKLVLLADGVVGEVALADIFGLLRLLRPVVVADERLLCRLDTGLLRPFPSVIDPMAVLSDARLLRVGL